MATHYDTLGLGREATPEEIKRAFRSLARRLHPDVAHDADSTSKFLEVKEAYEVLSDPERRRDYDAILALYDDQARRRGQAQRDAEERRRQKAEQRSRDEFEREQFQARTRPRPDASTATDAARLAGLLGAHRFAEAERLARAILERDPRNAVAYGALGDVAAYRGDLVSASSFFAYAAQFDPVNPLYQRRHEQLIFAASAGPQSRPGAPEPAVNPVPLVIGGFLVLVMGCYTVVAREEPLLPGIALVSTWTLGQLVMMLLAGVVTGTATAASGALHRFEAHGATSVMRVPPGTALAFVALINFWFATAMYVVIGITQDAFNFSVSRLLASVAASTIALALFAWQTSGAAMLQVLAWGGTLVYLGALMGWYVTDSLRRA